MKYGLLGLAALVLSTQAYAENYRIVQSPAQKLDVWIDDVKNNQLSSWCNSTINLRIVTMGEKNPTVLKEFLPRVAGLMATQCKPLQQLHWLLTDPEGSEIATGSAARAQQWKTVVTPAAPQQQQQQPTTAAVPVDALRNAAQADTSPWLQFSLLDGCHFRTWWQHPAQGSALFVPAKQGLVCGSDGWLSGQSRLTQQGNGASAAIGVTFLQGFPVTGLSNQSSTAELHITTVNSERMVLSNEKSPESWLVLPFSNRFNGWQAVRQVVVQMPASEAADESAVQARLQEVRKVWSPWVSGDGTLSVQLVEKLHPELKNPAAAVYRTLN
jgi:hypothetical protein